MTVPIDPERKIHFYMYWASSKTLTSVYDLIAEIQTFQLDEVWPVDSSEYKAVANTLEALKRLVASKQNNIKAKAEDLLD